MGSTYGMAAMSVGYPVSGYIPGYIGRANHLGVHDRGAGYEVNEY